MPLQLEVRSDATGDIIFKDMLPSGITAIVQGDYRGDGTDQLIVCGSGGEVWLSNSFQDALLSSLLGQITIYACSLILIPKNLLAHHKKMGGGGFQYYDSV